jgi:hypothetical protein
MSAEVGQPLVERVHPDAAAARLGCHRRVQSSSASSGA